MSKLTQQGIAWLGHALEVINPNNRGYSLSYIYEILSTTDFITNDINNNADNDIFYVLNELKLISDTDLMQIIVANNEGFQPTATINNNSAYAGYYGNENFRNLLGNSFALQVGQAGALAKIVLIPADVSGDGNVDALLDNQIVAGDPRDNPPGGDLSGDTVWTGGVAGQSQATIDLGAVYQNLEIYIYTDFGVVPDDDLVVQQSIDDVVYTASGSMETNQQVWRGMVMPVTNARYVKLLPGKQGQFDPSRINEVVMYGKLIGAGVPTGAIKYEGYKVILN